MKKSLTSILKIILVLSIILNCQFLTSCQSIYDVIEITNLMAALWGIGSFLGAAVIMFWANVIFKQSRSRKANSFKYILGLRVLVSWRKKNRILCCKIPQLWERSSLENEATFPEAEFEGYVTLSNTLADVADIVLIASKSIIGKEAKSDCSEPVLIHLGGPVHELETKNIIEKSMKTDKIKIFISEEKFNTFMEVCKSNRSTIPPGVIHNTNDAPKKKNSGTAGGLLIDNIFYRSDKNNDYCVIGRINRQISFGDTNSDTSDFFVFGHTNYATTAGIDYLSTQYQDLKKYIFKFKHKATTDSFLFVYIVKNNNGHWSIDDNIEPKDYSYCIRGMLN